MNALYHIRYLYRSLIVPQMIHYYVSIRLLLFPKLSENPIDIYYLKLCATACAGVCDNYKRLHHYSIALTYSPLAVQWIFLSGNLSDPIIYPTHSVPNFIRTHPYLLYLERPSRTLNACNYLERIFM